MAGKKFDAHDRLIRLGDMMGDGAHHENKWIAREYKKALIEAEPEVAEIFRKRRQEKNKLRDIAISKLLENFKCECGGTVVQNRSGSKKVHCTQCEKTYTATKSKKK